MEAGRLLAFAGATVVLVGLPGPNNVYISLRSLAQGRRAGLVSALAIETATLVHALAATLGLAALVAASPTLFTAITGAGAAYLALLGVRVLHAGSDPHAPVIRPEPLGRVYRDGIVVNLLNPKTAVFFLAFLPQFTSRDAPPGVVRTEMVTLSAATFLIAIVLDSAYAVGVAAAGRRLGFIGGRRAQRLVVAGVYFALAGLAVAGLVA